MGKIEQEKQMVEAMIRLYCKGMKHTSCSNCPHKIDATSEAERGSDSSLSTHISPPVLGGVPKGEGGISHPVLCPQCQSLLAYAHQRLDRCKFGNAKPSCTRCPVHCYKPAMRQQIRQVMRYSGPRMLLHHPILAIKHLWDFLLVRIGNLKG